MPPLSDYPIMPQELADLDRDGWRAVACALANAAAVGHPEVARRMIATHRSIAAGCADVQREHASAAALLERALDPAWGAGVRGEG